MMKKNLAQWLLLMCGLGFVVTSQAASDIYTWKNGSSSTYSDVPRSLQTEGVNKFNARTNTVKPATVAKEKTDADEPANPNESTDEALARKQAKLNAEIAAFNKKTVEENKAKEKENKDANCKAAQFNLQNIQSARSANKDALVQRYNEDVKRYCK